MTGSETGQRQLVTFRVANELLAADVFTVERVLRWESPRHLPNSSPWLRGVIDQGGRTVPVIDLAVRLGLGESESGEHARILLAGRDDGGVGLAVDAVLAVVTVPHDSFEEPPAIYRGVAREFLEGIARLGDKLFVVIAVEKLLTSTERIEMERAIAGEEGNA